MSKKPCDSLINHPLSRDQASPPRNGFGGHVQYPCRGRLSAPISTQSNSVPPQAAHIHSTPAIIRPGGHRWHSPPPNSWQSHNQERGPRGSLFLEVIIFDRSAGRRPFLLFPKVPAKSPGVKLATSGCHRRPAPPTANSVSRDPRGPIVRPRYPLPIISVTTSTPLVSAQILLNSPFTLFAHPPNRLLYSTVQTIQP